jgi:hypothetical protein
MAAGYWLLAAGCWLLAAGYWLLAAGCWLLAAGCWLLAAGRILIRATDMSIVQRRSVPLEVLHGAFMFFRGCPAGKRPKVTTLAGLRSLAGIESILA